MGRSTAPVSIRLVSDAQLADVESFAERHSMSRNAAIGVLISFGLKHEQQLMTHLVRQYAQRTREAG